MMKKLKRTFLFTVSFFFLCLFTQHTSLASTTFVDVPDTHWANTFIERMVQEGVVSGYPDGTFAPNNPVTRAEFCKIVVSAAQRYIPTIDEARALWCYVPDTKGHWAEQYINSMADNSWQYRKWYLSSGTNPNEAINRGEVAMGIADLLYGYPRSYVGREEEIEVYLSTRYADAASFGGFKTVVYEATINEFMSGYSDGTFSIGKKVTRAELCTALCNILDDLRKTTKEVIEFNEMSSMPAEISTSSEPQVNYTAYEEEHAALIEWAEQKINEIYEEGEQVYNEILEEYMLSNLQGNSGTDSEGNIDSFTAANMMRQQEAILRQIEPTAEAAKEEYIAEQLELLAGFVDEKTKELKSIYGI